MSEKLIHRKKLFDGKATAEEVHRKYAFAGRKCKGCGGPPAIRIVVFYPQADVAPELWAMFVASYVMRAENPPVIQLSAKYGGGLAMRVADVIACDQCKTAAMRTAARGPSYAIVDIDEGPKPDGAVVQVGGGSFVISKSTIVGS